MPAIRIIEGRKDTLRCYDVMAALRPQVPREEFALCVERQRQLGYLLAALEDEGVVRAVAGYHYGECFSWGRFLYVYDLVSASADRCKGYGGSLFDWLVAQAKEHGCDTLQLDCGVQRFGAHRFYLRKRMDITSHHLAIKLRE